MTLSQQLQAVHVGPTWERDAKGAFVLPRWTLGWQILGWTREYLQQPDGEKAGEPLLLTPEQARFALWWYAVDQAGRFAYRRGTLRRMKGWGKDPIGSVFSAVEFVGPCRFAGWKDGQPIAEPHPSAWVQVVATAQSQTKATTALFPGLFTQRAIDEYHIDLGLQISYADGGRRRLEAITSSPLALEGARSTFVLKSEIQNWLSSNDGHAMAAVIARNTAKTGGRVLNICNAHEPGRDSQGERDYEAWLKIASGKSKARGVLYDSLEAPPETVLADPESLTAGLNGCRGDSYWVDPERLLEEIYDPETTPSDARRFYLNQIVAAEDAWLAPHEWEVCAAPAKEVLEGEEITLGGDGSKSDDWTALVGCRVSDSHLFTLGLWDPEDFGGEIPRGEVDAAVKRARKKFVVVGMYHDLHPFESYVDSWDQEFGEDLYVKASAKHSIAWDMRGRQREATQMAETFHAAVLDEELTHEGKPGPTSHVLNARRRPNQYGVSFGKESRESARKVDWLAAAMLARKARQDYLALPERRRRRARSGRAVFA